MTTLSVPQGMTSDELRGLARKLRSISMKASRSRKKALRRLKEESNLKRAVFQLPAMPVPLSACFNNFGRRRIESKRYTAWKRETDAYIGVRETITGPVRVRYYVKRPDNRARDLDNLLKALNDTLTRLCVIEDDSKIVDLGIAWARAEIPNDCFVHVEVEAA